MTRILVCVRTHEANIERRRLYEHTVLRLLPYDTSQLSFWYVYGNSPTGTLRFGRAPVEAPIEYIQCMRLPAQDSYSNLPQKTYEMLKALQQLHHWTHAFICDDDAFLVPSRLLDLPLDRPYVGRIEDNWQDFGTGLRYASGGAGYLLSYEMVHSMGGAYLECITQPSAPIPNGADDLVVGRAAHALHIPLYSDYRLIPYGSAWLRPRPSNNLITSHKLPLSWWQASYEEFARCPSVPSSS